MCILYFHCDIMVQDIIDTIHMKKCLTYSIYNIYIFPTVSIYKVKKTLDLLTSPRQPIIH